MEDLREKYTSRIKSLYPDTPDYVIGEFVQTQIIDNPSVVKRIENTYFGDIAPELRGYPDWFLKGPWVLDTLELGWDDFDVTTKQGFLDREFGEKNPYQVYNDKLRSEYQKSIQTGDGKNEPVLLSYDGTHYTLIEGWHRTMAILSLGDNGDHPDTWEKQKIRAFIHL